MRLPSACLCTLALGVALQHSGAQEKPLEAKTAFDAVRVLSAEQQAALAIITARGGTPEPERWHLLAHDPASENGLREFVIAKGKVAATRTVSQFAEKLTADAVFAPESLKVDSERVIRAARDFARHNRVTLASMHFDLRRGGPDGAAIWTAICLNPGGEEIGRLILSATTPGAVISHVGFAFAPPAEGAPPPTTFADRRGKSKTQTSNTSRRRPTPYASPRQMPPPPPPPQPQRGTFFQRVFGGSR